MAQPYHGLAAALADAAPAEGRILMGQAARPVMAKEEANRVHRTNPSQDRFAGRPYNEAMTIP
jgi:hypothetical protein